MFQATFCFSLPLGLASRLPHYCIIMSSKPTLIRHLKKGRTDWVLEARVTRIWESFAFDKVSSKPTHMTGYELVFLDSEGFQIVAGMKKKFHCKYATYLEEGGLYTIKNFSVKEAWPKYRVVENDLAIEFLPNTTVKPFEREDFTFPFHRFSVVPFDHLSGRLGTVAQLPDVVGRLHSSTNLELVGPDQDVKRRIIHLEDSNNSRLAIALIGNKAELITESDLSTSPVLVVTSVLLKTWQGSMSISSSTSTRIFRNLDIPETKSYEIGVDAVPKAVPIVGRPSRALTYAELQEKRRTLQEIVSYCDSPLQQEAIFYASARTTRVLIENDWSYPSCDAHNRMVSTIDNKFHCVDCSGEPRQTSLRYRLELEVQDPTSVVIFTLFDKEVVKLLDVRAEELALEFSDEKDYDSLVEKLNALSGLELLFCVRVSDFNFRSSKRSFTVLRTYNDQEIPHEPSAPQSSPAPVATQPGLGPPTPLKKQKRGQGKHAVFQDASDSEVSPKLCKRSKGSKPMHQKDKGLGKRVAVDSSDSGSEPDVIR